MDLESTMLANKDLSTISAEEKQLLHLRSQLAKIKMFREEKVKKNQTIQLLHERIAVLENEKSIFRAQNNELNEIMCERIQSLERHVAEKESAEKIYHERIICLEKIAEQSYDTAEDFASLRKRCDDLRAQLQNAQNEIDMQRTREQSDHRLIEHLQSLIQAKDQSMEELRTQNRHNIQIAVKDEAEKLTSLLEETSSKLCGAEKKASKLELLNTRLEENLEAANKEIMQLRNEVENCRTTARECEQQLFKETLTNSHIKEQKEKFELKMSEMCTDNDRLRTDNERLRSELQKIRRCIADFTKKIKALDEVLCNESDAAVKEMCAEQHELVQSLRRAMYESEGMDMHRVVSGLCEILFCCAGRTGAHEPVCMTQRNESAFVETSERFTLILRECWSLENIVCSVAELLVQASLVPFSQGVYKSTSLIEGHFLQRERRRNAALQLLTGAKAAVQTVHALRLQEDLLPLLKKSQSELAALRVQHAQDMERLHRANDDALLAVRASDEEAQQSMHQMRVDAERLVAEQRKEHAAIVAAMCADRQEIAELFERSLRGCSLLASTISMRNEQFEKLRAAYRLNSSLLHGYEILLNDVKTLADLSLKRDLATMDIESLAGRMRDNERRRFRHVNLRAIALLVLAALRMMRIAKEAKLRRADQRKRFERERVLCDRLRAMSHGRETRWPLQTLSYDWSLPTLQDLRDEDLEELIARTHRAHRGARENERITILFADMPWASKTKSSLRGNSLLQVVGAGDVSFAGKELFAQREVNQLHKFILDTHTREDNLLECYSSLLPREPLGDWSSSRWLAELEDTNDHSRDLWDMHRSCDDLRTPSHHTPHTPPHCALATTEMRRTELRSLDESKDSELQDVFREIGRLSTKLESRIRASSLTRSVGEKSV